MRKEEGREEGEGRKEKGEGIGISIIDIHQSTRSITQIWSLSIICFHCLDVDLQIGPNQNCSRLRTNNLILSAKGGTGTPLPPEIHRSFGHPCPCLTHSDVSGISGHGSICLCFQWCGFVNLIFYDSSALGDC